MFNYRFWLQLILMSFSVFAGASGAAPPEYDAELSNYSYPFPVQYYEFQSQRQKLKMAYMDVQPLVPNGRVVVLLHGKNFSGFYWEPTVRILTQVGFRVIVPDQLGFGKSSKPADYHFSFQELASNSEALLEKLKVNRAIIVGHSMGGMLAARFALMYPQMTEKLVMINPLGLEDWRLKVPYRSVDALFHDELELTEEKIRDYQKKSYYDGRWAPEYEALIQAQLGWTRHPDYPKVAWDAALTSEMIYTQPVLYEFPVLKTPTLLIIGQRDNTAIGKKWISKELAEGLGDYAKLGKLAAHAIDHAKLVEIQGAGHMPQAEKFSEYKTALLDFILN